MSINTVYFAELILILLPGQGSENIYKGIYFSNLSYICSGNRRIAASITHVIFNVLRVSNYVFMKVYMQSLTSQPVDHEEPGKQMVLGDQVKENVKSIELLYFFLCS